MAQDTAVTDQEFVVEGPRRLSQSLIWPLQRAFYTREGPRAWKPKGVPSFVTNNAFIARAYARVAVAFLRDLAAAGLDPAQPVHVIELAGGAGRFAYLVLRALQEARRELPALAAVPVRYVLTDLVPSNLETAAGHERLRPFVEQGLVDFARYDLERDDALELQVSGQRIAAGSLLNPAVVIANYAFDSIPHDVYRVRGGRLQHSLCSLVSTREEPALDDPALLERARLRWEGAPLEGADVYEDPLANAVLAGYARLADTSVVIPVGALRCIRTLREWTGGRLLLLCGDKSFSTEQELLAKNDPALAIHGGSFSITVNFDAIAAYFAAAGGSALLPSRRDIQFKVGAFLAGAGPAAETRAAFASEIDGFGPADYFHLSYTLRKEHAAPSFDVMLSLFKLGDWDPELVVACREVITKNARTAPAWMKQELSEGLDKAWLAAYPLHRNLALDLAWIALALERPHQAIHLAQESLRVFGKNALALSVIALAYAMLKDNGNALRYAERALALQPDNAAARQLKQVLTAGKSAAPPAR